MAISGNPIDGERDSVKLFKDAILDEFDGGKNDGIPRELFQILIDFDKIPPNQRPPRVSERTSHELVR